MPENHPKNHQLGWPRWLQPQQSPQHHHGDCHRVQRRFLKRPIFWCVHFLWQLFHRFLNAMLNLHGWMMLSATMKIWIPHPFTTTVWHIQGWLTTRWPAHGNAKPPDANQHDVGHGKLTWKKMNNFAVVFPCKACDDYITNLIHQSWQIMLHRAVWWDQRRSVSSPKPSRKTWIAELLTQTKHNHWILMNVHADFPLVSAICADMSWKSGIAQPCRAASVDFHHLSQNATPATEFEHRHHFHSADNAIRKLHAPRHIWSAAPATQMRSEVSKVLRLPR